MITFVLLMMAAVLGFSFQLPGVIPTAVFLTGLFGCGLLLGIMVNILILSFGQKVEITAWMFAHLFMILCGIYYPIDMLPIFFKNLALLVPITHYLEFFRQSYGFKASTPYPLAAAVVLTFAYLFVFLHLLGRAYTRARKKGIIIRLSE